MMAIQWCSLLTPREQPRQNIQRKMMTHRGMGEFFYGMTCRGVVASVREGAEIDLRAPFSSMRWLDGGGNGYWAGVDWTVGCRVASGTRKLGVRRMKAEPAVGPRESPPPSLSALVGRKWGSGHSKAIVSLAYSNSSFVTSVCEGGWKIVRLSPLNSVDMLTPEVAEITPFSVLPYLCRLGESRMNDSVFEALSWVRFQVCEMKNATTHQKTSLLTCLESSWCRRRIFSRTNHRLRNLQAWAAKM